MKNLISYGNAHMSPCKECAERHENCHSTCTKGYKEYKKMLEEEREKIHQAKERHGLVFGHIKDVRKKQKQGSWKVDRRGTH